MLYTSEQIKNLLQQGESQTVEFERQIEVQRLAELIAAFANTDGGLIIIGAEGPSLIVGCDIVKTEQVYTCARSKLDTSPPAKLEFLIVDKKNLAIITVEKAIKLIPLNGKAPLRVGTKTETTSVPSFSFRKFWWNRLIEKGAAKEILRLRQRARVKRGRRDTQIMIVCFVLGSILFSVFFFIIFKYRQNEWFTGPREILKNYILLLAIIAGVLTAFVIGVGLVANLLISYAHSLDDKLEYNQGKFERVREILDAEKWERTWKEYDLHICLYRFYIDIGLKANLFFYFITGAILGIYLQNPGKLTKISLLLPILMSISMGGVFIHGAILWLRVTYIIKDIRKELKIEKAPDIHLMSLLLLVFGIIFLIVGTSIFLIAMLT